LKLSAKLSATEGGEGGEGGDGADNRDLERALHNAIKKVTEAVANLKFNTAIASMMELVNEATRAKVMPRAWFESFIRILAPFAPHLAEELWQLLGHRESITYAPWPAYDEAKLLGDAMLIAVQVSGKMRGQISVPLDATEAQILAAAKADDKVRTFLDGKPIKREIYIKGRLVNLVV
ncbi:MAG TPA: class I tRNA ligase family protein, partial [Kofleriaceae bacterium]|nr:class I tRNA ligase family protein [Kofleriaceae bacterium]